MKKLTPENYKKVAALFSDATPNLSLVQGIIDGTLPGEIHVDDENNPRACFVNGNAPYCFIAGTVNKQLCEEVYKLIKDKTWIKIIFEPRAQIESADFFQSLGFKPVQRLHYRFHKPVPPSEIPSGYELIPIKDKALFDKCLWGVFMLQFFGDFNNYLTHGLGFVLWDTLNQRIASEAHSVPAKSKNIAEIGVITHTDDRNKKLGSIVTSHLINLLIRSGVRPVWSCDAANVNSAKMADKHGMEDKTMYTLLERKLD